MSQSPSDGWLLMSSEQVDHWAAVLTSGTTRRDHLLSPSLLAVVIPHSARLGALLSHLERHFEQQLSSTTLSSWGLTTCPLFGGNLTDLSAIDLRRHDSPKGTYIEEVSTHPCPSLIYIALFLF